MQFTFDPIQFLSTGGALFAPVLFTVIGLTWAAGEFGLKGKHQLAFALGVGFLLGGGLQFAVAKPAVYADYFAVFVYACVMAVTPSLLYEQAKGLIAKIIERAFSARSE